MAQEFTINSSAIETKINQLLPSQGGFGAGIDFSASTMVIPIVDLTETASGSSLRVDLQTSMSHKSQTAFSVQNATTTVINTTGYYRIFGSVSVTGSGTGIFKINDGSSDKILMQYKGASGFSTFESYDFTILLEAGDRDWETLPNIL
jgi:hypothetical protein